MSNKSRQRKKYTRKKKKKKLNSKRAKSLLPIQRRKKVSREVQRDTVEVEDAVVIDDDGSKKKRKEKEMTRNTNLEFLSKYKNIIFTVLWIYLFIRLLFTDIDAILIRDYLNITITRYVTYRIVFAFILFIFVWIRIGNKRFWKNLGLLTAYPFYPGIYLVGKLFVWDIPKLLVNLKSVYYFYVYVEFATDFIVNFKRKIIKYLVTMLCIYLIWTAKFDLEWVFLIVLLLYLQYDHILKRWVELFGPIKIFQMDISNATDNPITVEKLEKQIDDEIEKEKEKNKSSDIFKAQMEKFVFTNEIFRVFDKQIKNIIRTQTYLKSFILSAFYSFFYAVIIFGCVNYSLYQIDNSQFNTNQNQDGVFEFIYYSFFNIFSEGVDVEPSAKWSKLFRMIGVSVGVIVNFLILGVLFTVNTERYKSNLRRVSSWSDNFSDKFSKRFAEKFDRNPEDGEHWLRSQGSKIIDSINDLRNAVNK